MLSLCFCVINLRRSLRLVSSISLCKSSSKCSRKHMSHSVWLQNLENNKRNTENAAAAGQMSSCCLPLSLVYLYVMKTPFHIISCWVIEKLDHAFNSPFLNTRVLVKETGGNRVRKHENSNYSKLQFLFCQITNLNFRAKIEALGKLKKYKYLNFRA